MNTLEEVRTVYAELALTREVLEPIITAARRQIADRERQLEEAVGAHFGIPSGKVQMDDWDCPDSPIGICVYDMSKPPYSDQCVVCGDPSERK